MAGITYGGNGPGFTLLEKDVEELREKKVLDLESNSGDLYGRIRLVSYDPNKLGDFSMFDSFCEPGLRIRRAPWIEGIDSPKPHYYVVRMQENLFGEMVNNAIKDKLDGDCIFPRCRYDRFSIHIFMI